MNNNEKLRNALAAVSEAVDMTVEASKQVDIAEAKRRKFVQTEREKIQQAGHTLHAVYGAVQKRLCYRGRVYWFDGSTVKLEDDAVVLDELATPERKDGGR